MMQAFFFNRDMKMLLNWYPLVNQDPSIWLNLLRNFHINQQLLEVWLSYTENKQMEEQLKT